MKPLFLFFTILFAIRLQAQLQGLVVNEKGNPFQDVSVHIQNSYQVTVTNKDSVFLIEKQPPQGTLVFSYLGYEIQTLVFTEPLTAIHIKMHISPVTLHEVELVSSENPAHLIIRKAQAQRKIILEQNQTFTAQFYSRGIFGMSDVPKTFLGVEIGDFEGALDSTRSGILYLSETQSKIFRNKEDFTEVVIASKVSGDDNGFSFNSAKDADLNFYQNTFNFGNAIVSPIGSNAFTYYHYRLEDSFYTPEGKLINKITITPKTASSPAYRGTIYIVEDDWALYGVDVLLEKQRIRLTGMEDMHILQQFQHNSNNQNWSKVNQVIDFSFRIFGFKGQGRFSAFYSDYDYNPTFAPKTFGAALQRFEELANKKDSLYWKKNRPIQLTIEEKKDYRRKDSIRTVRSSPHYLDSIDRANNTFKWKDILGKTIQNSQKRTRSAYLSPLQNLNFNALQGSVLGIQLNWKKDSEITKKNHEIRVGTDYGFADQNGILT